jgi:uncharacterized repeat protein (TIGR01451 family)
MKRIIFRIAMLGGIIVLGLIAIAQAQRNSDKSAGATGASASTSTSASTGSASATAKPAVLPNSLESNPLRATGRKPTPLDAGPSLDRVAFQREVTDRTDTIPDASTLALDAKEAPRDKPQNSRYAELSTFPQSDSELKEPEPLRADPFALPAKSTRSATNEPVDYERPASSTPLDSAAPGNLMPLGSSQRRIGASDLPGTSVVESAPSGEGSGRPGGKQIEGPQTPQLTVQKIAPPEIQVGKPATFRVVVRNTGQATANGVEIHDQIPKGTRVVSSTPKASRGVQGEMVWVLGTLKPGEETAVEVQLMPLSEGEIGSVATVTFNTDASARTIATKPQLVVDATGPERVLLGDELTISIIVSNPGTGTATGVVLEEHIPDGLQHPAGRDLEYPVGELRPGESKKLELTLTAKTAGRVVNLLTARGDGNLQVENKRNIEVTSPRLNVAVEGPKKRYLEREATYQVAVSNPGTAPAEQIELVAYLPSGLKFVSANNGGHYEDSNRAVRWRLEELPVNETGTVELVTLPVEPGQQSLKLTGTASRGLKTEKEQQVVIEGIAAVLFQVSKTADPVEVGGETTYEIKVVNQGSKAATNVRVAVNLPAEMKAVAAEGPTRNLIDGTRVMFDGLARLAPKADTTYHIRAQAMQPGDLRARIQLMTDEMSTPVTKEESTRVFADE